MMKKAIAVICLVLLFSQAIPIAHLFISGDDAALFSMIDEDKPTETKFKENKLGKEFITYPVELLANNQVQTFERHNAATLLPSPFLAYFAPPPDRS